MKKFTRKIFIIPLIVLFSIIVLVLLFDKIIMPWYVNAPELAVPDVVGMNKQEAIDSLRALKLNPIEEGPRYDDKTPKNHIIYQNPRSGVNVKEGRRVYLYISGGEPKLKTPNVVGKTFRDAKITIERLGLEIGEVDSVRSEFLAKTVIDQKPVEGLTIEKGTKINLKVSVGPKIGMIRVPNLIGKSLREAKKILSENSLRLGKENYQVSANLLPNTIFEQFPSPDKLVSVGDSVDVFLTKTN